MAKELSVANLSQLVIELHQKGLHEEAELVELATQVLIDFALEKTKTHR